VNPDGIRGVLFDLDDTLMDHRGAAEDALRTWAGHVGLRISHEELVITWEVLERRYYELYQRGALTRTEQRRARIRELMSAPDLDNRDADAMFETYWDLYRSAWRTFPDAEDAVDRALSAGLRVGVLTNGDHRDQRSKIEATALAGFDLPVFASSRLPAAKPDPRAFQSACAALEVDPSECLMVGDSLVNDVGGAVNAGLSAALVDRAGAHRGEPGAYRVISSLTDLHFGCGPGQGVPKLQKY